MAKKTVKKRKSAKTSEKIAALAARVLDDGNATPEEVKRLAGSVLRQREQRGKRVNYDGGLVRGVLMGLPAEFYDNYDKWLRVGAAVYNATAGSSHGMKMWDEFSQQSQSYDPAEIEPRWAAFGKGKFRAVTLAVLIAAGK